MQNFYANGLGYLYTDAKFTIQEYEVLNCKLGAIAEGALPNPSGFKGVVKASLSFFGQDYSILKGFSVGQMCKMEPNVDASGNPVEVSSPVENYVLIENINITNGEKEVAMSQIPRIKLGVDKNKVITVNYNDGSGGQKTRVYRYNTSFRLEYFSNNSYKLDDYKQTFNTEDKLITLQPTHSSNGTLRDRTGRS